MSLFSSEKHWGRQAAPVKFLLIELFDALFYYPIFLAGYFLFYQATRLRLVNSFFSYASWSRFLKQYREPGTSLKDLLEKKDANSIGIADPLNLAALKEE